MKIPKKQNTFWWSNYNNALVKEKVRFRNFQWIQLIQPWECMEILTNISFLKLRFRNVRSWNKIIKMPLHPSNVKKWCLSLLNGLNMLHPTSFKHFAFSSLSLFFFFSYYCFIYIYIWETSTEKDLLYQEVRRDGPCFHQITYDHFTRWTTSSFYVHQCSTIW